MGILASRALYIAAIIFNLILFFPVWINIIFAPAHIITQTIIVFGLLQLKSFQLSLQPKSFALWATGIPFFFNCFQALGTIPIYIATESNVIEILIVTFITGAVCLIEYSINLWLFKKWLSNKQNVINAS